MTGILWLARKVVPAVLWSSLRPIGNIVPRSVIWAFARPVVAAVTFLELVYTGPTFAEFQRLPASMIRPRRGWAWRLDLWRERTALNLARLAVYWTDQLTAPRWGRLCRYEGPPSSFELIEARTCPVILVTLHYGPFEMLYYWFRARRVPIAILAAHDISQRPEHRRRLLDLCDRTTGLGHLPRLFTPVQLKGAATFLRSNRVLLVLASAASVHQFDVDEGDVSLPLSPGAFRLAALVNAIVLPCVIRADLHGTMTIALGDPLPPASLMDRRGDRATCEQLLRFWLPSLRSSPGQCDPWLLRCLQPRGDPRKRPAEPKTAGRS